MPIEYPTRQNLLQTLKQANNSTLDFIVLVTGALYPEIGTDVLKEYLAECVRVLKNGGVLFVQGRPDYLPDLGVYLDQYLNFKYWITLESSIQNPTKGLPSVHAGLLLFTKGNGRFNVKRTRFPHQMCDACDRTLKDWGGKAHLMNPEGYVISDVWKDIPKKNNYTQISETVLQTVLRMLDLKGHEGDNAGMFSGMDIENEELAGLVAPLEGVPSLSATRSIAEPKFQYQLPGFSPPKIKSEIAQKSIDAKSVDVVHHGDAVTILKQIPENSIDLVFADPPYNLDKEYSRYDDELEEKTYIEWCNEWLFEYARVLKPTGSLFVLNLPRWTIYHADFLNKHLYFQNWIVWDALSEPRGKLMPAHYGLLFYTKRPTDFTFNYEELSEIDARQYCLRASCIRKRKANGEDGKMPLTDIWWDIHRIKHRRDRDYHPCQLPDKLMERIIRLMTNEGDVVLDALAGAGTTPVIAARLNRRYVAIDMDEYYVQIMEDKLAMMKENGSIERESIKKEKKAFSKKELQLELRELASELGRLPTPEDVKTKSKYDLQVFFDAFPTWGKALKAAKLEVQND